MLFQIFFHYFKNVNFQPLSLIIAFGYNDVSLLKHAQISLTWYGILIIIYNLLYNMEAKVTCFLSNIMELNSFF